MNVDEEDINMKLEFKKVVKKTTIRKIVKAIAECNPKACVEGRYFVALSDGRIAGWVALVRRAWYITELKHLFVIEEYRGCGIGKFIVEEALKKVRTPLASCTVRSDNERSISIFSRQLFEQRVSFQNTRTNNQIFFMVRKMDS